MYKATIIAALTAMVVLVGTTSASSAPIRSGFDASGLGETDDGSSGPTDLGFSLDFFGVMQNSVYVNNNGNITFDAALSQFSPSPLVDINRSIITPFFADVDTANDGIGDSVTYGQGQVNGRDAFGVNWLNVNYYNNNTYEDQLNNFQLVLVDRSDTGVGNFDIEFNYGSILWEAGIASGGDTLGQGGNSARAGFSAGSGAAGSYFELEGSGVNGAFIDGGTFALGENSNIGIDGRFLFSVRGGALTEPEVPLIPSPLPAGLPLLIGGIGLLAFLRHKRA